MSDGHDAAPARATTRAPVSIVIAVSGGDAGLGECLAAVARQRDAGTQIIAVGAAGLGAEIVRRHPWLEWVDASPTALVPELWSLGLSRARQPIVAITTAHFRPAPDYLGAVRASHARSPAVGIGGAIDPPRGCGVVAWATYFLRYSAYLGWHHERDVTDFAGDNGTYKRAALAAHPRFLDHGFWEQDLHRVLRAERASLRFAPTIRVRQRAAFPLRHFVAERFQHGVRFGRGRLVGTSVANRWARIAGAPLIPLVFLARIAARVIRSRRDLGAFLAALPVLCMLVLAWSAGEGVGYLLGPAVAAPSSHALPGVNVSPARSIGAAGVRQDR